jgi:hypothetical protein
MRGSLIAFVVIASTFAAGDALAVKAIAHCSATGRFGLGIGETAAEAADDAVSKCIVGGGIAGCCHLLGTTEDAECIALATGPGVVKGFGSSSNSAMTKLCGAAGWREEGGRAQRRLLKYDFTLGNAAAQPLR